MTNQSQPLEFHLPNIISSHARLIDGSEKCKKQNSVNHLFDSLKSDTNMGNAQSYSGLTSQRTQPVSNIKTNQLMQVRELIDVYCGSHINHIKALSNERRGR